jgi:hypothetical protein
MALQDFTASAASLPVDGGGKHFIIKSLINCYNTVAEGGYGNLAAADTARILEIKEGWLVKRIWVRLVKIGTLGATVLDKIEDEDSGDWITTDMNIGTTGTVNQVKGCVHATDANAILNGFLYLKDTYLFMTITTEAFDGKLEIAAEVIDVFGGNTLV